MTKKKKKVKEPTGVFVRTHVRRREERAMSRLRTLDATDAGRSAQGRLKRNNTVDPARLGYLSGRKIVGPFRKRFGLWSRDAII